MDRIIPARWDVRSVREVDVVFGMRLARILIAVCLAAAPLCGSGQGGQEAAAGKDAQYVPTLTFDVASIRETKGGFRVGGGFEPSNSSNWTLENNDLLNLICWAYAIDAHNVDGWRKLPFELLHATFNVRAKADDAADEKLAKLTKAQVGLEHQHMIQVLLAERFNLKVHWETREGPVYDLVVQNAKKLHAGYALPSDEEMKAWGNRDVPPLYQTGGTLHGFEYIAHGATMADVAVILAGQFGVSVNDRTGLTEKYSFDLKTYQVRESDRAEGETNPWPPLETAIQDQLGLKLVPSRGPVQFLVIDHAEMPSAN